MRAAAYPVPVGAQHGGVERLVVQRAAGGLAPLPLRVVIGARERREADRRARLEVPGHLRRAVDEGLEKFLGGLSPRHATEIAQGLVAGVEDAQLPHVMVAGDPQHPARHRRRPADPVGLLENGHAAAAVPRAQRGHQAGAA